MKKRNRYIKIGMMVLILAGSSFFAWAKFIQTSVKTPVTIVQPEAQAELKYDRQTLEKFSRVCAKITVNNDEFFLSGTISSLNGADSTGNFRNATYLLNRKGQQMYCKFGRTETINEPDINLFVDHNLKKMMISQEKKIVGGAGFPDLSKLTKNMKGEGYQLLSDHVGKLEKISLINENHISCKAYQLTFDSESLDPTQLYIRLSDTEKPESKAMDKVIEINIKEIGQHSKSFEGLRGLVKRSGSSWVPGAGYEDYVLVVI